MVYIISRLAKNGNIDNTFLSASGVVVSKEDVLKLMTCKCDDSLLVVVKNVTIVAIRIEFGNEGGGIVSGGERLVSNDRFAEA